MIQLAEVRIENLESSINIQEAKIKDMENEVSFLKKVLNIGCISKRIGCEERS